MASPAAGALVMEHWLRMCRVCGWADRRSTYLSREHAADAPMVWRPDTLIPSYAACTNCGSTTGYEPVPEPVSDHGRSSEP